MVGVTHLLCCKSLEFSSFHIRWFFSQTKSPWTSGDSSVSSSLIACCYAFKSAGKLHPGIDKGPQHIADGCGFARLPGNRSSCLHVMKFGFHSTRMRNLSVHSHDIGSSSISVVLYLA